MKEIILVYELQDDQVVQTQVVPLFSDFTINLHPFFINHKYDFHDSLVVTYLSDQSLAELICKILYQNCTLGFLPHPNMQEAMLGFDVDEKLESAAETIIQGPAAVNTDLLLCNGYPVFHKVVIGNSISLVTGSLSQTAIASFLEKTFSVFKHINKLIPHYFTINTDDKPTLKTTAVGLVAVLHGKNSILSRQVLKSNYTTDGRLHAFVLSPRSVLQLLRFYITTLLFFNRSRRLPSFIGHIKAKTINVDGPDPMDFSLDNTLMSARRIVFTVQADAFKTIPTGFQLEEEQTGEPTEMYRVDKLPKDESYMKEIVAKPLSLINHASTDEFRGLFDVLRENAKVSGSFLTLMVLSTLLSSLGLFSNSSPVIIGAMILAPLMAPIISLSMGVLRQDKKLVLSSAKTIGLGLLLSYMAAILITWLSPLHSMNQEIVSRIKPNLLDLGIAIISGIAGAYAHARTDIAKTLAGVAIAVALVPPLAVSGIGVGWGDWTVFTGALLLFTTNLTGIVLAGTATFMLLGFSPFHLARKGLIISLLLVALVSIPLWLGFSTMVRDHQIIQELDGHTIRNITIRDVNIIQNKPMLISIRLLAEGPISMQELDIIKKEIENKVGQQVQLEIVVSIRR
ncbi:TIGR00341 family protein [Pontibacter sp. MBLB2868]|uniref:TIGR00341 family protein n=1 Tax=Pontibacter sp. MBLB2868 TaxID=3451555 RepID=UPI003F74C1A5